VVEAGKIKLKKHFLMKLNCCYLVNQT